MKAALNGGLNLSILDGWWDEWFDGDNGWAIPSADGVEDTDKRDDLEAEALYDLIENEVAPRFYDVDDDGVPTRWLEMVRHTLKSLGPKVLATRMVRDYVRDALRPRGAQRPGAQRRLHRCRRAGRVEEEGPHGLGQRPGRARREQRRRRRPRGRRDAERPRPSSALGDLATDDVDVQVVHGEDRQRGPAGRHHRRGAAPPSPTTAAATASTATSSSTGRRLRLHGPGHPAQRLLTSSPSWVSSRCLSRPRMLGYTVRVVPRNPTC